MGSSEWWICRDFSRTTEASFRAPFFLKTEKAPSPIWARWHIHCAPKRAKIFLGCGGLQILMTLDLFGRKSLLNLQVKPGWTKWTESMGQQESTPLVACQLQSIITDKPIKHQDLEVIMAETI